MVHIRVLDQALNHRVIECDQSPWMKPYMELNTGRRMKARNDFEKDFYKLLNNSAFGKTMENIRKHRDIKFATNWRKYVKLLCKDNYVSSKSLYPEVSYYPPKSEVKRQKLIECVLT